MIASLSLHEQLKHLASLLLLKGAQRQLSQPPFNFDWPAISAFEMAGRSKA
jgi:hypothetical protein